MFCYKCGKAMPDQASVCPQCGAAMQNAPQPMSPQAVPPQPQVAPSAYPSYGAPVQQSEGKATASLVLGILSLTCFGMFAGIPAVILGHMAKSTIRKSNGTLSGDGKATAGLIMGYISIALVPLILLLMIPSFVGQRSAANESAAASTVRTLNTTQITYSTMYPVAGYARDLSGLGPGPSGTCGEPNQQHACLIDSTLGCHDAWCTKDSYSYNVTGYGCSADGPCTDYVITAAPAGSVGKKRYCATSDAVVRVQSGGAMTTPPNVAECQSWNPL